MYQITAITSVATTFKPAQIPVMYVLHATSHSVSSVLPTHNVRVMGNDSLRSIN